MINPEESGEDVTDEFEQVPREKKGMVVSARFNLDEARMVFDAAAREHMTVSAYVRMCVLKGSEEATVWLRYEPGMTASYTR